MLAYPAGFKPYPRYVPTPDRYNMQYENVELITEDKVKLRCFLVRRFGNLKNARGTVIFFHGIAVNHGEMLSQVKELYEFNLATLTVDYRGYGHSEGVPSENGIRLDAQAAIDYVKNHHILCKLPIILFGHGLGGAVAIYTASKNPNTVSAVIVENTYTSIPDLLKSMPVIRYFSWMSTQKWRSSTALSRLPTSLPILILSGRMDEYIPYTYMEKLWKIAMNRGRSESKNSVPNEEYRPPMNDMFRVFPDGMHYYTSHEPYYWETVFEFLDPLIRISHTET
ncbi:Protein bem46 [Psilocybe cubensis]|uniref:Protein bem46 n=1 Tax=Psilocybe cubensis TaxID=181762 RepID=A0ACB8GZP2_PSICU|nr:Protein bem46 [Psilocybe cubensis]KAH9481003.1 Protein bem46 [Psilocybe cubensis]